MTEQASWQEVESQIYRPMLGALLLIAEEAGGRATTLGGERRIDGGSLITSNGVLHQSALSALNANP